MSFKHYCSIENAPRFAEWIEKRGGVAVWGNLYIGDETGWSTPALAADGTPTQKPSWKATNEPLATYTDPAEIGVVTYREFARFRVALRVGRNGLSVKLTDGSNRKLNRKLAQAGVGSTYYFDYDTQEAVVLQPVETMSLAEWMEKCWVRS